MRSVKLFWAILLVVLLSIGIAACGSGEKPQTDGAAQKQQASQKDDGKASGSSELPKILNIGTHPLGSTVYAMSTGLAKVVGDHLPINIKVANTTGPMEWVPMLASGEIDLGVLGSFDAMQAYNGQGDYAKTLGNKGAPLRLLTAGSPAYIGLVAAEDSGVKSGKDLKGKRLVGVVSNNAGATAVAQGGLLNLGYSPKDVKMVTVPDPTSAIRALIEGQADVSMASLGMSVVSELDAGRGARFISFDPSPEALQRFREVFPGVKATKVEPAKGRFGVKEPVFVADYPFIFVGNDKLSDNTAYQIVKTLWENYKELAPIHPYLKDWVADRFVDKDTVIPYHPGAVKFYKEVGVWNAEMDNLQKSLLAGK